VTAGRGAWRILSSWPRYVAAIAAVVVVAGLSLSLEPLLGRVPTAGLVAVVLLVAWFCGLGPALCATGLAAVLLAIAPPYELAGWPAAHVTGVVVFVTVSGVVSWLASTWRRMERERSVLLERERTARAEAERLSRAKDEFLATVSHELRSPLMAILGWVQVLRRTPAESGRMRVALDTIERNTLLQGRLIGDLLDVARIVEGKLTVSRHRIDLVPVVRQVVESYRPTARDKHVELVDESVIASAHVVADDQRIEQIVGNVVSNAIKFTPRDGRVTIRLECARDRLRIVVTDTGAGIPADLLPHVFERFRQGEAGLATGGLGLGLAIVKHLVTLHEGTVRAESAGKDRGATFIVELPLGESREATPSPPAAVET
jgi:signal transduction histidine kinase